MKQVSTLKKGLVIFLTGLSGAGKTTIAEALNKEISKRFGRAITLLDGDVIRKILSSELGFSKEDRNINVKRVSFVAAEIAKHGGLVICAMIAPYCDSRREFREMVANYGHFVEVYVSTPLAVCEKRDPKGLYTKARLGLIKNFTGIDDPYEKPENPELIIDTSDISCAEAVDMIIKYLTQQGYLAG
ncbi:adenylyl-sulfate kinase [Desulfurispora thermophila]|uniref:adenylyl-sulfate kinase n=1 Tax=Desulfurispora thermophila TaxID=265470 RepID=UPI00037A15D6|nr:adenylyl-sulfate kinase [Desulfurispora thermophila]